MNSKEIKACCNSQMELEKAIKRHEKLIWYVIHSFKPNAFLENGIDKNDFYQIAIIGFIKSIKSYKQNKKTKFYTYATTVIKNEIKTYLMRKSHTIRIPDNEYPLIKKIKQYQSKGLSDEEICEAFNLSLDDYNKITQCSNTLISLEEIDVEHFFNDNNYENSDTLMLIDALCENETGKTVIVMKYEGYSKKEIADTLSLSYKEITLILESFKQRLLEKKE